VELDPGIGLVTNILELREQLRLAIITESVLVQDTGRGESATVCVNFTVPDLPGTVRPSWIMVNDTEEPCCPKHAGLWCQVRVIRI